LATLEEQPKSKTSRSRIGKLNNFLSKIKNPLMSGFYKIKIFKLELFQIIQLLN